MPSGETGRVDDPATSAGAGATGQSDAGAEMPPAAGPGSGSDVRYALPGLEVKDPRPLLTAPLPRTAAARGRLVAGFPAFLRPIRGSVVETSSVSAAERRLQVALVGSTARRPDAVLRLYRARLSTRGMRETRTPPATAGAEAAAFVLRKSAVTVTVRRERGRTSYSLYGVLHIGGE